MAVCCHRHSQHRLSVSLFRRNTNLDFSLGTYVDLDHNFTHGKILLPDHCSRLRSCRKDGSIIRHKTCGVNKEEAVLYTASSEYVQFYLRRTFTRTVVRILTVTLAMASTLPSICRLRQLVYRSLLRREPYNCIIRWTSQYANKEMAVSGHCHFSAQIIRASLWS